MTDARTLKIKSALMTDLLEAVGRDASQILMDRLEKKRTKSTEPRTQTTTESETQPTGE